MNARDPNRLSEAALQSKLRRLGHRGSPATPTHPRYSGEPSEVAMRKLHRRLGNMLERGQDDLLLIRQRLQRLPAAHVAAVQGILTMIDDRLTQWRILEEQVRRDRGEITPAGDLLQQHLERRHAG